MHCFKIRTSTGKDQEWAVIYVHVSLLIPGYTRRQLGSEGTVPEEADEIESDSNSQVLPADLASTPPPAYINTPQ